MRAGGVASSPMMQVEVTVLPGARLPDEASDLPGPDREVDPAKRAGGRTAPAVEADRQAPHVEQGTARVRPHQPILIFGLSAL